MPKITYTVKRLGQEALDIIKEVNGIVEEYNRQGLVLTLRQIYYQFVARGLLANHDRNYKRLGDIVSDGRMIGAIDWEAIEDRTRFLRTKPHWDSPAEIVSACARQFHVDMWKNQPWYVEVWVEKDALVGVVEAACTPLDVPYFSCRGYASQTALWEAGLRISSLPENKEVLILHLGDHDPSGIDMTRDIRERVSLFSGKSNIEIRRIALNMDQVETYSPPPNPAKLTDSRCAGYIARYGTESWELDSLEPSMLIKLMKDTIMDVVDNKAWAERTALKHAGRKSLSAVSENWNDVVEFVGGK